MSTTAQSLPALPGSGWQERAACRLVDPEMFFGRDNEPKRERVEREERARAVCQGCPVREPCRRHAIAVPERFGVWGATTEEERDRLRREERRVTAA